jgi:hypothetical protein
MGDDRNSANFYLTITPYKNIIVQVKNKIKDNNMLLFRDQAATGKDNPDKALIMELIFKLSTTS